MNVKLGVLGLVWSMAAGAQNPVITSFPGTGTLTWENPSNFVFNYRVEWASRAEGPWSDFTCTAPLDYIIPTGAVMSASVSSLPTTALMPVSSVIPVTTTA